MDTESRIIEVPCVCALNAMVDPEWEAFPCACSGPATYRARDGRVGYLALVEDPRADPPETPGLELARLVLHRPDGMGLSAWLDELRAAAARVTGEDPTR